MAGQLYRPRFLEYRINPTLPWRRVEVASVGRLSASWNHAVQSANTGAQMIELRRTIGALRQAARGTPLGVP